MMTFRTSGTSESILPQRKTPTYSRAARSGQRLLHGGDQRARVAGHRHQEDAIRLVSVPDEGADVGRRPPEPGLDDLDGLRAGREAGAPPQPVGRRPAL